MEGMVIMVGLGIVIEALLTGFAFSVLVVSGRGAVRADMAGHKGIALVALIVSILGAIGMVITITLDGWFVGLVGVLMGMEMAIIIARGIGRYTA